MRKLTRAVRSHGAAAVFIGVDQRSESGGTFEPRIETEAHFAEHLEIGPEAGAHDHLVDVDRHVFVADGAGDANAAIRVVDAANSIRRDDANASTLDGTSRPLAELSARLE